MNDNVIEIGHLHFSYGRRQILNDVSLSIARGSIFGFLGPNGAGKTTTIKCILGLLHPEKGNIDVFGEDFRQQRLAILARMGAMVEEPSLYEHLTASQNLEVCRRLRKGDKKRIGEVLDIVGLTTDAGRPVRQFSSGMKQRLCLAIALLPHPEILLLDEPINGLDPAGIIEIRTLLQRLNSEEGCTIFLSSHILSEIEKLCGRVGVIHKGKILYQGSMEGLLSQRSGKVGIIVETNDNKKALLLLQEHYQAMATDHHLLVHAENRDAIAAIARLLVGNGLDLYQLRAETTSLENSFLELIND